MQRQFTGNTSLKLVQGRTAITTTAVNGTAYVRKHGKSLAIVVDFDYSTDSDATYTTKLQEQATVGGSWADVAATDVAEVNGSTTTYNVALLQTDLAALTQANTLIFNYLGTKDQVRVVTTPANHTSGTTFRVTALEEGMKLATGGNQ